MKIVSFKDLTEYEQSSVESTIKYIWGKVVKKYLGKKNNLENRTYICMEVNEELDKIAREGYLNNKSYAELSVDSTKRYLISIGEDKDLEDISDRMILSANIKHHIFITFYMSLIGTEDKYVKINVDFGHSSLDNE